MTAKRSIFFIIASIVMYQDCRNRFLVCQILPFYHRPLQGAKIGIRQPVQPAFPAYFIFFRRKTHKHLQKRKGRVSLPSRTKRESRKRSRFFFRVEYRGVEQLVARRAQAVKLDRLMSTKLKGDIAEQAAILMALKKGIGVSKPIGDRLPYDLVFDVQGVLLKIQVKSAWFDQQKQNFVADNRRTKTNRREMKRSSYTEIDFDFALVFIEDLNLFYVFPVNVFINYGSEIHLVEAGKRQRKPVSSVFRDAWDLILQRAVSAEMPE